MKCELGPACNEEFDAATWKERGRPSCPECKGKRPGGKKFCSFACEDLHYWREPGTSEAKYQTRVEAPQ